MAKNESTAVNELIERMTTMKPLRPDPADDLLFREPAPPARPVGPLPRSRSAHGTPPVPTARPEAATTMKGLAPVAPPAPPAPPASPRARNQTPAPRSMPVAAPFEGAAMTVVGSRGRAQPAHAASGSMVGQPPHASASAPNRAWFEEAHARLDSVQHDVRHDVQHEETWVGTLQLPRRSRRRPFAGKLIVAVILVASAGAGGYFALERLADQPRVADARLAAAPAAVAAPSAPSAPVAAPSAPAVPVEAAVQAAAPAPAPTVTRPSFVDVMILSAPAGATVTLVDRGKTSFIGTTPIATALDPSRRYELVFSHPSKPTWIEPIDPSTTRRVDVQLGRAGKPAQPPTPAASVDKPAAARRVDRPAAAAAPARAVKAAAAAPVPAGDGILMISSKPPCEIVIDGKPTGLTTPQREIPLPAGSHKVTLVNEAEGIRKTIAVQINPDKPTKVIQDLMK